MMKGYRISYHLQSTLGKYCYSNSTEFGGNFRACKSKTWGCKMWIYLEMWPIKTVQIAVLLLIFHKLKTVFNSLSKNPGN